MVSITGPNLVGDGERKECLAVEGYEDARIIGVFFFFLKLYKLMGCYSMRLDQYLVLFISPLILLQKAKNSSSLILLLLFFSN